MAKSKCHTRHTCMQLKYNFTFDESVQGSLVIGSHRLKLTTWLEIPRLIIPYREGKKREGNLLWVTDVRDCGLRSLSSASTVLCPTQAHPVRRLYFTFFGPTLPHHDVR